MQDLSLYRSAVCLGGSLRPGRGQKLRAQPPELLCVCVGGHRTDEERLKGDWNLHFDSSPRWLMEL